MTVAEQPRLLIVDDEEAICEGCRRVLSRQGYSVDKTSDPREGLSRATADDYAAILLDIKMPEMSGLDFLSQLRSRQRDTPVILMTGFPSVPTAVSAISLGAAGYVTKPFTPEEISQAVHRFANQGRAAVTEASQSGEEPAAGTEPAPRLQMKFWHDAWVVATERGAYRCGAVVSGLTAGAIESVQLPKLGEVVYQGLPMASVRTRDGKTHTICAPLTGVVESVHEQLADQVDALVHAPCTAGWLAEIGATRLDIELSSCLARRALVLAAEPTVATRHMQRLRVVGCETHAYVGGSTGRGWSEMVHRLATESDDVVLMDAASLGAEGPQMAAGINVQSPSTRIIVVASPSCAWESAYRSSRIFYYVVEPFEDQELVEVVDSAFARPVVRRARESRTGTVERVAQIHITNRRGENVVLLAAPGVLVRNTGLGAEIRGLIYDRLYPIQTFPGNASIAPRDVLNLAHKFDHVVVLESRELGRLPGMLVRDKGTELAALGGDDAARVTTLSVQRAGDDPSLDSLDAHTITQLARHIVGVMSGE